MRVDPSVEVIYVIPNDAPYFDERWRGCASGQIAIGSRICEEGAAETNVQSRVAFGEESLSNVVHAETLRHEIRRPYFM